MKNKSAQQGASLFMGLVILLVISILGISSVRLSILDTLMASNDEQKMLVTQTSETTKKKVVYFYYLFKWISANETPEKITTTMKSTTISSQVEINSGEFYPCFGQTGEAMSLGPAAPKCRVFSFEIESKIAGTGAQERLVKGEGKEFPNIHGHSF
ncbi:MAG: pilus assembly PilX N-terminal domain-containing protein [Cocleimonas sp.]|nr:pilus assembly PilX N-terminal domain-containing protein [Cocleimonas sp.]